MDSNYYVTVKVHVWDRSMGAALAEVEKRLGHNPDRHNGQSDPKDVGVVKVIGIEAEK